MRTSYTVLLLLIHSSLAISNARGDEQVSPEHAKKMLAGTELFQKSVRSILTSRCLACHGGETLEGEFNLASREGLLQGGESGKGVIPGKSADSHLYKLITHAEQPHMPYDEEKLPDAEIAAIAQWIDLGAPYDSPLVDGPVELKDWTHRTIPESARDYWAFQPLMTIAPPHIDGDDWSQTDIDRFILKAQHERGLKPNEPADRHVLIRRACFDLTGLPPEPEELHRSINDTSSDWYAKLIDRLLDSPHFGEHWARKWLDVARFAESHGFEQDYNRDFAFHYRDFVIRAFNSDMPFDQFTRWQLAGDEIAPNDPLALMATGFLGAGVFPTQLTEKEFEPARYDELDDMVATMGTAMLGMTIGCARCHDHKFDPIPAADYYRLLSTFGSTIRSHVEVDLTPEATLQQLDKWQRELDPLKQRLVDYEQQDLENQFEKWLAVGAPVESNTATWMNLHVEKTVSAGGATLTVQPDESVLATGSNPDFDTYTFHAQTRLKQIRSIRVEALAHESMERGGPGRAPNGNMGLGTITVVAQPMTGDADAATVQLINPRATFEQNNSNLSIAAAIDNTARTGWAVDPQFGKDHAAIFDFETPLAGFEGGTRLTVTLHFDVNNKHNIGRARLSVSNHAITPELTAKSQSQAVTELVELVRSGAALTDPTQQNQVLSWYRQIDLEWQKLAALIADHEAKKPLPQKSTIMVSTEGMKPLSHHADGRGFPHFYKETFYLKRGDTNQKLRPAQPGFLQALTTGDPKRWMENSAANTRTSLQRTALANWITDAEDGAGHQLARVIVNRLWQHHFGQGIVSTVNDFGKQGEPPTHPELLDWLARRLIDEHWQLKPIHKLIMLSRVFQQDSTFDDARSSLDPENRYCWRREPGRLPAESIRDAMLAISGQLDRTPFGPGTLDEAQKRRSIYFMVKRSSLIPMMQIFDAPEPLVSVGDRPTTTIASQALMFMNSPHVRNYAAGLSHRCEDAAADVVVNCIYRTALSRDATDSEQKSAMSFVASQAESYVADGMTPQKAHDLAMTDFCQAILSLNEFVFLN